MIQRISRYFSILLISLLCTTAVFAQYEDRTPRKLPANMRDKTEDKLSIPLFCGVSISADLVGPAMKAMNSDYAQMEVAARVSLKEKFLPVIELGYGTSKHTHEETNNTFKTKAPYFRVGMDYNFSKRPFSGNRIYAGVRYGFTDFTYDINSPNFIDPIWHTTQPFDLRDLEGNMHWAEVVFGLETKIWKIFRLGWNLRYKARISHKQSAYGEPWYVPGFGKNGSSCLGATFNVIFEI